MTAPKIFLCMPSYDGTVVGQAARAFYLTATSYLPVARAEVGRSFLTNCFNTLWAAALNARKTVGITHFAMLHTDVVPMDGWLDVLYMVLMKHRADVVSTVIPIKSMHGLTSTAIGRDGEMEPDRRLTMDEVLRLPETFDLEDLGIRLKADLWINTGCWICDFSKDWVEDVCFRFEDRIEKDKDGEFRAVSLSEDWGFSQQLHRHGLKVLATTKVKAEHVGVASYSNEFAWGQLKTDDKGQGPMPTLPALTAKTA
jgi:hypothetical protein